LTTGTARTRPKTTELAQSIYRALKAEGLIDSRVIEQFFDPEKNMFLPDRLHQGRMPQVPRQGPVRRQLRGVRRGLRPDRPDQPYSALSGATPVLRSSEHFFFKLSDPRCVEFLREWTQSGRCSPKWPTRPAKNGSRANKGLGDWDISRDAPYFGIEIPDAPGKYFYVWLDAPDRLPGQPEAPLRHRRRGASSRLSPSINSADPAWSSTTSSARTSSLPHAVLAGHAALQRPQDTQQRVCARVHHRQRRQDEQEPRHRHLARCKLPRAWA
jgi:hypothetical protein